jgi:hypothetical protein
MRSSVLRKSRRVAHEHFLIDDVTRRETDSDTRILVEQGGVEHADLNL